MYCLYCSINVISLDLFKAEMGPPFCSCSFVSAPHLSLPSLFLYISIDTPCPLSSLHSFLHVLSLHFLYYLYLDFISFFLPQPVSLPHFLLMHNPHGGQDLSESTQTQKKRKHFY
ncbi:hypothetical protein XENOCAPTIV_000817 [Xenoophorus captivus]|uniref:Uncharacterized protein n=1 Tax=Xenoophorus captivus TaxID=1517983 RepID=A0ABV0RWI3_9TELE